MKQYRIHILMILLLVFGCGKPPVNQLSSGDIIFQTSLSNQSKAIQLATHSKYSHMGMIFLKNGKPYVYEAFDTVQYTPLEEWIDRGEGDHYVVKRLRDAGQVLTPQAIEKLKRAARQFQGKPYDFTFEWSDDRMYCSELVWKIYQRGIGVPIGKPQKLRDIDLSHPVVKTKMKERYGDHVPLNETVISPGEMYSSELLTIVTKQ